MNAAAERMLGWTENELLGHQVEDLIHRRRPDGVAPPAADSPLAGVFRDRRTVRSREDALVRRDGRLLPVRCSATPEAGGGIVIAFSDVTEEIEKRRRAERRLDSIGWVGRVRDGARRGPPRAALPADPAAAGRRRPRGAAAADDRPGRRARPRRRLSPRRRGARPELRDRPLGHRAGGALRRARPDRADQPVRRLGRRPARARAHRVASCARSERPPATSSSRSPRPRC